MHGLLLCFVHLDMFIAYYYMLVVVEQKGLEDVLEKAIILLGNI